MTITIKRSGGFAGIEQVLAQVDTKSLTRDQIERVKSGIARLSGLLAKKSPSAGADRFQYDVTVTEDAGAAKTMTVIDQGNPKDPALMALMDLISSVQG
jgi:chemotaxis regulatin CheY-phosphate phosphatase CheZ